MANLARLASGRRARLRQRPRSWVQRCWCWLFCSSLVGRLAAQFTPRTRVYAARSARATLDQLPLSTATVLPQAVLPRRVVLPRFSLGLAAHCTAIGVVMLVVCWSMAFPLWSSTFQQPLVAQQTRTLPTVFDQQVVPQVQQRAPVVQPEDAFGAEAGHQSFGPRSVVLAEPVLSTPALPTVRDDQTNLRAGPGRAYDLVARLQVGSALRLVARHAQWVQVDVADAGAGWVRADLLAVPQATLDALPLTSDFAPPPPRWVWPARGTMTSTFGWRFEPFRSFHNGIDIANRAGTPVLAAHAGTVAQAGWCRGFGYCVYLDHGAGVVSVYGHLLKKPPVAVGNVVDVGTLIGLMGSTYDASGGGYSTGVHLHFTVKVNGKTVDPLRFLP